MSDASISPGPGAQFTPRPTVPIQVSSFTVNLYPAMEETIAVHERADAFHVNKAALASQSIPI